MMGQQTFNGRIKHKEYCIKVFINLHRNEDMVQAFTTDLVNAWNVAVNSGKGGNRLISVIVVPMVYQWDAGEI